MIDEATMSWGEQASAGSSKDTNETKETPSQSADDLQVGTSLPPDLILIVFIHGYVCNYILNELARFLSYGHQFQRNRFHIS